MMILNDSITGFNMKELIAIILASGKGTRFGMPKVEANWQGSSFPEIIQATLQTAGVETIRLAKGYNTLDMLSTLRQAITELNDKHNANCSGYLIFPVDFPFVTPDTICKLLAAHHSTPMAIIRPRCDGFSGHPIIIPADFNVFGDDYKQGLKGLIMHSKTDIVDVQVEDNGVHRNINYPKDLN
ncbi:MAG: NTP transferase domain-containing protein [Candidatus Cloacimonetes bacterium]|nr:NTP transferase domain-containing protein [Candidatus Cloacimonadota bacterium]